MFGFYERGPPFINRTILPAANHFFGYQSNRHTGFVQHRHHRNQQRSTSLQQSYKKSRDSVRMTAFMNRKDSANLPFYNEDNSTVRGMCYNSLKLLSIQQSNKMNEQFIANLKTENESKDARIKTLLKENNYLSGKTSVQNKLIVKLRENIKDLEENIATSNSEIQKLKEENEQLEHTSDLFEQTGHRVLSALNGQYKYLEIIAEKQRDKILKLEHLIWAASDDVNMLSNSVILLKHPAHKGSIFLYRCASCCGHVDHTVPQCPAQGNKCKLCDKENHFSISCDKKDSFITPRFYAPIGPYGL